MSSVTLQADPPRLPAAERRARIVEAATAVFGSRGYIGATTDQIARAAGISQPYVVRMFGSKEQLFIEVVAAARSALLVAFREALAGERAAGRGGDAEAVGRALGHRYLELARDRGIHLALMQAFVQGADPVVGAAARAGYLEIWRWLREEAGLGVDAARDFLAQGMLISVLLGMELPTHLDGDPGALELVRAACGDEIDLLLGGAPAGDGQRNDPA